MTIGRHASALQNSAQGSSRMTYNITPGSFTLLSSVLSPRRQAPYSLLPTLLIRGCQSWRPYSNMGSPVNSHLWDPSKGLRFSPSPQRLPSRQSTSSPRLFSYSRILNDKDHSPMQDLLPGKVETISKAQRCSAAIDAIPSTSVTFRIENETGQQVTTDAASSAPDGAVIERVAPPTTSLEYQISSNKFHDARDSTTGSKQSYWSHLMYQRLGEDGAAQNVKVHYCTSKHTTEHVCQKYFEGEEVLGFDLEWSPFANRNSGVRQNVSLIQIASASRIGLFHVARFSKDDFVAPTLRKIMEDSKVSKVGVAIKADCTRLKNYLGIDTQGVLELSHLYKVVKYSKDGRHELINKQLVTLAAQVQEFLHLPLYKGDSVRSSDWSRSLNAQQITYSASDAYAGFQLYQILEEERLKLSPCPPRPHHAELGLPLRIAVEVENSASDDSDVSGSSDAEYAPKAGEKTRVPRTPRPRKIKTVDVKSPKPTAAAKQNRDSRIIVAELKMKQYKSSPKLVSTPPSALRAYYMWHINDDLNPEAIAKLLRDPPLQTHTVISYIMNAVAAEKLPYNKTRMREELLVTLNPNAMTAVKYQVLVKDCGVPMLAGPPASGSGSQ